MTTKTIEELRKRLRDVRYYDDGMPSATFTALSSAIDELAALRAQVEALTAERDEARDWVRRITAEQRTLTCVYCGHAYPPGTPAHGSPVLTAHIAACEKHPLRIVTAERDAANKELVSLRHDCESLMSAVNVAAHAQRIAVEAAREAAFEACAKVCDDLGARSYADAIRARGKETV